MKHTQMHHDIKFKNPKRIILLVVLLQIVCIYSVFLHLRVETIFNVGVCLCLSVSMTLKNTFSAWMYTEGVCLCFSYQQTVKENVDKHPETADDEVHEVVEELKIQHHGFVASCKGSTIPNKTYQEYQFIAHLRKKSFQN